MAAAAHHDHIQLLTYSELRSLTPSGHGFLAQVVKKPRYVIEDLCTGCRQCEYACPIDLPDAFDLNLGARRAIAVPFSTAMPQKAVLDIDHCLFCGKCERACPAAAVDFTQTPQELRDRGRHRHSGDRL